MTRKAPRGLNRRGFLSTPAALFAATMVANGGETQDRTGASPLWREGISLIPYPQRVELTGDSFVLENGINIVVNPRPSPAEKFTADDLAARLNHDFGIRAHVGTSSGPRSIQLTRGGAAAECGEQGYELAAANNEVRLCAASDEGLFYGTRTLLQLVQRSSSRLRIAGMRIVDWPDIGQRGAL